MCRSAIRQTLMSVRDPYAQLDRKEVLLLKQPQRPTCTPQWRGTCVSQWSGSYQIIIRTQSRTNALRETTLRTRCAARPCAAAQRTGRVLRVVLVVPSMLSSHSPASVPSVFRVATTPWSSVAAAAVVSGAGVTSYDRRWCWCRHAHTSSRHPPAPNLHICLLRKHFVDCRS